MQKNYTKNAVFIMMVRHFLWKSNFQDNKIKRIREMTREELILLVEKIMKCQGSEKKLTK